MYGKMLVGKHRVNHFFSSCFEFSFWSVVPLYSAVGTVKADRKEK